MAWLLATQTKKEDRHRSEGHDPFRTMYQNGGVQLPSSERPTRG